MLDEDDVVTIEPILAIVDPETKEQTGIKTNDPIVLTADEEGLFTGYITLAELESSKETYYGCLFKLTDMQGTEFYSEEQYYVILEDFYEDVDVDDPYYDAVIFAYMNDLISDTGEDPMLFYPHKAITYGEAASILYALSEFLESHFAVDVDSEILSDLFDPQSRTTRADFVVMIFEYLHDYNSR